MSKQVRFRRGTTAQHAAFTGALGEVTMDTDKDVTVVHNGSTAGGFPSAREDRARGFTKVEYFTTAGAATYSTTGKVNLKRLRVTCYGGGGGGGSGSNAGGGGQGGVTVRTLDISEITTTVAVTVGAAGGAGASGGTTSFGAYVVSTGGGAGSGNQGGTGGSGSGSNTIVIGGQGGIGGTSFSAGGFFQPQGEGGTPVAPVSFSYAGSGGGPGGGSYNTAAKGIYGSGGGPNSSGSAGSVIVEEIYGLV
jgi:hypothetical protein